MRIVTKEDIRKMMPANIEIREESPGLIEVYAQKEAWARGEMGFFQRLRLACNIIKGPPISSRSLGLNLSRQDRNAFLRGLAYAAKLAKKIRGRDRSADPAIDLGMALVVEALDHAYYKKSKQHEKGSCPLFGE